MSTVAPPRALPVAGHAAAGGSHLPLWLARGGVLLAFAVFAGLHWAGLLEPADHGRAWVAAGLAALVVLALVAAARLAGPWRWVTATLVAFVAIALALLAGGLADENLRPDRWGVLLSGAGRGIEALPGVRVPYRGVDEWTRLAISSGGTLLAVLAALLAFWPRRDRTGFPAAALLALLTLYAVPIVILSFQIEFLGGAILALLMLAFLRLEKLRARDAGPAAAVAVAAAVGALIAAPALDGDDPWFDYESWAVETAAGKSVAFNWNHDYSPLDWPRDGRELLRIKAREPAYWKARDLVLFDGRSWRQDPRRRMESPVAQLPDNPANVARWRQRIEVTVRNLRSDSFVTAGIATAVDGEAAFPIGGGVYRAPDGLDRGDSYSAEVYTPRPTERQLRASTDMEYGDWMRAYVWIYVEEPGAEPADGASRDPSVPHRVMWPLWGEQGEPVAERFGNFERSATRILEDGDLARIWGLAQRLKRESATPFEYVERVEALLEDGFGYSERPPRASETLDGFLFDSKIGFCQQFSGAEALLLRMAGIPARVATGFTSGSFDDRGREYVVRDLDAHSWVEAWFPGFGWVTRDATPAAAPPRSQAGEDGAAAGGGPLPGAPSFGGDRSSDPQTGRAQAQDQGGGWTGFALGGALAALVIVAGLAEWRRRKRLPPPAQRPMAEFERALRRARFHGGPGMTLSRIERELSGWPGAAGYVRALREQRYSGRPAVPTAAQRRGLRAALARDAGALRSWWALPPRGPRGA